MHVSTIRAEAILINLSIILLSNSNNFAYYAQISPIILKIMPTLKWL